MDTFAASETNIIRIIIIKATCNSDICKSRSCWWIYLMQSHLLLQIFHCEQWHHNGGKNNIKVENVTILQTI